MYRKLVQLEQNYGYMFHFATKCPFAPSREQFLLNDLYDKQTNDYHWWLFYTTYWYLFNTLVDEKKVRIRMNIHNIFLN